MLHLLETFKVVAETGSLSKAAEALHMSQPAVTRHIKALEQDLGAVLLARTAHGVELTPVGRDVLAHAREALAAVAACRLAASQSGANADGEHLRISAGNMLMQFVVAPVAALLKAERPNLKVELFSGNYQDCLDRLTAYEVDLALISTPQIPHGLKARVLFTDPVVLAMAPDHPLAAGPEIDLTALRGQTIQVLPKEAGLRQELARVLHGAAVECHLVEQSSVETVKTMVSLGIGVTILPESAVAAEVRQGRLRSARVANWPQGGRQVMAVTRAEGALPSVVTAFVRQLEAYRHSAI